MPAIVKLASCQVFYFPALYAGIFLHFKNIVVKLVIEVKHMELKISSLQETNDLGYKLGKLLQTNDVITLSGDLGAGKTTLTKAIGKALNIKKAINSPTFTILKTYHGDKTLNHIDAYRLENGSQDLGFEELFDDGITIIEWPQFMSEYLPEERLEISIKRLDEEERLFEFVACGDRYEHILKELVK